MLVDAALHLAQKSAVVGCLNCAEKELLFVGFKIAQGRNWAACTWWSIPHPVSVQTSLGHIYCRGCCCFTGFRNTGPGSVWSPHFQKQAPHVSGYAAPIRLGIGGKRPCGLAVPALRNLVPPNETFARWKRRDDS